MEGFKNSVKIPTLGAVTCSSTQDTFRHQITVIHHLKKGSELTEKH